MKNEDKELELYIGEKKIVSGKILEVLCDGKGNLLFVKQQGANRVYEQKIDLYFYDFEEEKVTLIAEDYDAYIYFGKNKIYYFKDKHNVEEDDWPRYNMYVFHGKSSKLLEKGITNKMATANWSLGHEVHMIYSAM